MCPNYRPNTDSTSLAIGCRTTTLPLGRTHLSARELARRTRESAPFQWLCGGVTVNHRLLSDFRTALGAAAGGAQTGGDRAVGAGRSTVAGTEAEAGRGRKARGTRQAGQEGPRVSTTDAEARRHLAIFGAKPAKERSPQQSPLSAGCNGGGAEFPPNEKKGGSLCGDPPFSVRTTWPDSGVRQWRPGLAPGPRLAGSRPLQHSD